MFTLSTSTKEEVKYLLNSIYIDLIAAIDANNDDTNRYQEDTFDLSAIIESIPYLQVLGYGASSVCVRHLNCADSAFKISFKKNDPWLEYANFCLNNQDNSAFLRIFGIEIFSPKINNESPTLYIAAIEMLSEIEGSEFEPSTDGYFVQAVLSYGWDEVSKITTDEPSDIDLAVTNTVNSIKEEYTIFDDTFIKTQMGFVRAFVLTMKKLVIISGFCEDISTDNVMMRDNTLVITDPI